MHQKTMSEKDHFLMVWEHEWPLTLAVLESFPPDQAEFKPSDKSRTARTLAWMFVLQQMVIDHALQGQIDLGKTQRPAPATFEEVVRQFAKLAGETTAKLRAVTDEAFDKQIEFPSGPDTMEEIPVGKACWMMLHDAIHHRGQMTVYLRMVGAKVPAVYGPSADEPMRRK